MDRTRRTKNARLSFLHNSPKHDHVEGHVSLENTLQLSECCWFLSTVSNEAFMQKYQRKTGKRGLYVFYRSPIETISR